MVHFSWAEALRYSEVIRGLNSALLVRGYSNCTMYKLAHMCSGYDNTVQIRFSKSFNHRGPTQSVCVADCYFIVNVLDLPFASPIAIYR